MHLKNAGSPVLWCRTHNTEPLKTSAFLKNSSLKNPFGKRSIAPAASVPFGQGCHSVAQRAMRGSGVYTLGVQSSMVASCSSSRVCLPSLIRKKIIHCWTLFLCRHHLTSNVSMPALSKFSRVRIT